MARLYSPTQWHILSSQTVYTVREGAVKHLYSSVNTLERLHHQRGLPHYRIGGSIRLGKWDLIGLFLASRHFLPSLQLINIVS